MSRAVGPKFFGEGKAWGMDKPKPNSVIVHLVLFSVQICFSGWHVLAKVALNDGVNAVALAMSREACATVLMFCIARRMDGKVTLDPAHAVRILWMGIASCGNVVGAMLALRHFNPMAFGVMQPSIPVFAMILSYMCGLERMSRLVCVGVLISVAGAVWVEFFATASRWVEDTSGGVSAAATVMEAAAAASSAGVEGLVGDGGQGGAGAGASAAGGVAWLGSLILFWQCGSMAALLVLQKPMLSVYPPATLTAWYYAVGSALTIVVCACYGVQPEDFLLTGKREVDYFKKKCENSTPRRDTARARPRPTPTESGEASKPWIALAYAVIVSTVYTYNAYSWVLNTVSTTTATTYLTLQPVTTAILSVVFLHTTIRGHEIFGGVVIAFGLLVTIHAKGIERRGSSIRLRAKQDRELSRVFKTPRRHRFRRSVAVGGGSGGGATSGDVSNSDTDGAGMGFDSDQDPLLGGLAGAGRRGSYDPLEASRMDGSLRRFLALV